jgi:hypothetical protein
MTSVKKQKITFLFGLPGSGKSSFLKDHARELETSVVFDDYHASAVGDSPEFGNSKYYEALKSALRGGKDCLVIDIDYCKSDRLAEATAGIERLGKELGIELKIEYVCFENDPDACIRNIQKQRGEQMSDRINFVRTVSPQYMPPREATIIPVKEG